MTTMLVGQPDVLDGLLAERRRLGQDGSDEVWEGVYHVAPHEHERNGFIAQEINAALRAPARARGLRGTGPGNVGVDAQDYRVPDGVWSARERPMALYVAEPVAVLEVLPPQDETFAKLPFYRRHGVEEVLVADPASRSITVLVRDDGPEPYVAAERSAVFDVTAADLTAQVDWPE